MKKSFLDPSTIVDVLYEKDGKKGLKQMSLEKAIEEKTIWSAKKWVVKIGQKDYLKGCNKLG